MSYSKQAGGIEQASRRSSGCIAILLGCIGLGACSPPDRTLSTLSYSLAPGTVDSTPTSAFADLLTDYPPEPNGSPHNFSEGKGVQAFADGLIGKHVANFVSQNVVYSFLSGREFHYFYPLAGIGPVAGICRSRVYSVIRDLDRRVDRSAPSASAAGEWQNDLFAVAGSVAPLPRTSREYTARLNAACRARRDMAIWFSAEPKDAVTAARLADLIVAAARRPGPIPFALSCRPYPADIREEPRCQANVRYTVASINPRAIVRVDDCFEILQRPCLAVLLAKFPDQPSLAEEEQWTLNVQYQDAAGLKIARVDVDDTQIIVE